MRNLKLKDRSIKTKYYRILLLLFVAIMAGGIGLVFYINAQQEQLDQKRDVLQYKTATINELAVTLSEVFFSGREVMWLPRVRMSLRC
ncbi:hypothetical protein ACFTAO_28710 [Paenibacillus rhizoplanae]